MNVVIKHSGIPLRPRDINALFGTEPIKIIDGDMVKLLPNLLVALGIFPSMSKARQAGRTGEIPKGWNVIKASKKVELFIWNPTE